MEARLALLAAAERPGVTVTDLCRELEVSRDTFYELRRRFEAEGVTGLLPRSRRPHGSPNQTPAWLEDEIVRLRKELPLDNGARSIAYALERAGLPVPDVRTIHRVLVRRGMVTPQPDKRPRSSYKRFEFDRPNGCWQMDATAWPLRGGVTAWIMDALDDCSRVSTAAQVVDGPTKAAALCAFEAGITAWGPPAMVLSDNGGCFTGGPAGEPSSFSSALGALGIRTINSRPRHPQTCGKIERFHQTLKKWLRAQPLARHGGELQAQLDRFRDYYNNERGHWALGGATPAQRFAALEPAVPEGAALSRSPKVTIGAVTVQRDGTVMLGQRHRTCVGAELAGEHLALIRYGRRAVLLRGEAVITSLTIDPTKRYQPSGRPRGRRRRS